MENFLYNAALDIMTLILFFSAALGKLNQIYMYIWNESQGDCPDSAETTHKLVGIVCSLKSVAEWISDHNGTKKRNNCRNLICVLNVQNDV